MHLEISFRFSTEERGRSSVSDWIKGMKQKEDEAKQQGQLENNLRLHRAAIIKAKAPAFWLSITERVEVDCAELNETFKHNLRRHCEFQRRDPDGFVVTGKTPALNILRLNLNLDALGVDQEFFAGEVRRANRGILEFGIDTNDEIYISGLGGQLNDPGRISEQLIKKVIQE